MAMSERIRADSPSDPPPPSEEPQPPPQPQSDPPPPPPAEPDGEPEPEATEATQSEKDLQRRLDQLTRDKYQAQRQRDEYSAMLQQYQRHQQQPQQGYQQPADPVEQGRQQGRQEAYEETLARRFNEDCNTLFKKGQDEFGDMQQAVEALNAVGYGNRPDALAALTQLPDGHRVYRDLAADLDNAARVLQMPPMQMAVELARMSRAHEASPAPSVSRETPTRGSSAPAPLRPVGGNSARAERPLDQVSMAEFIRRRDRDERRSRIAR